MTAKLSYSEKYYYLNSHILPATFEKNVHTIVVRTEVQNYGKPCISCSFSLRHFDRNEDRAAEPYKKYFDVITNLAPEDLTYFALLGIELTEEVRPNWIQILNSVFLMGFISVGGSDAFP